MKQDKGDILLVDDMPDNLRVLSSMLATEGYKVRKVTNGKLALKVICRLPPDLILLDVAMPGMDGYEVCQALKSTPEYASIPIIFISALDDVLDKIKAFSVGAVDYITKPFQSKEVIARVENQLKLLRLQNQLRSQNEALTIEVEARLKAQQALESTLAMRDDLSNMLVHDLRNPITTISLISKSLLKRTKFDSNSPQYRSLELLQETTQKLNQLINDLLVIAKMDSGKMLLTRTNVDGNKLITDVASTMRTIVESKQSRLITKLPEQGQNIRIDINLVSRVLDNLISNSTKYSESEKTIVVDLEYLVAEDSEATRQVKIRVLDQGFGMSEEQQKSIFEKFEVGNAIKGITRFGLGLAFCKLVIEAHGGQILVEANQPNGSIFTVIL